MPTAPSKHPRGQTLLEGVIAIGVILTGVVGSLVLVNTTINLGRANQDRIVAQNLAREGIELTYALRNAGAIVGADVATTNWSSYISDTLPPSDAGRVAQLQKYNVGYTDISGVCGVWGGGGAGACGPFPVCINQVPVAADPAEATLDKCDSDALFKYLSSVYSARPPMCDNPPNTAMPVAQNGCDYTEDGTTDISDLEAMITDLFVNSNILSAGYPTIASVSGQATDSHIEFPKLADPDVNWQYPDYENVMWSDSRSMVYENNGAFVQNALLGPSDGSVATKFRRVVTVQSICRNRLNSAEEVTLPLPESRRCEDSSFISGGMWNGHASWTSGASTVGYLVTSEVRWPLPTSSAKVRYQEFMYDWINT